MTRIRFRISLSSEAFLNYYQGVARAVIVSAEDGRKVQLPAARLRPFLLRDGIHGRFEILLSPENRLVDIRRISE
ncbi:MAG: DUF2835 domain-containing protein [Gammaproteobacteria bacterium]|nr:DUF2835 domain-containing protein [Gammaproteobacteria bacterium]